MIDFINIQKSFGKFQVLKGINLHLSQQECIALIGPNGCGKTTLIKSLLGMVLPDSGQIVFQGKSIRGEYDYRHAIGYMPQIGRYPDNMTIAQVIDMIQDIRGGTERPDYTLYDQFGLQNLATKKMHTLSGGTTQKVSAVLAFLFNPKVLVLDEPTAGLDPLASNLLKEKIRSEKDQGKLILITSHLLSELDDLVTRIIFMQDGCIQFNKPVEELLQETREKRISQAIAKILKSSAHA